MTPAEAALQLQEWGDDAESENYHTLAAMLWELSTEVARITERTLVLVPLEYDGIQRLLVQP